MGPRSARPEYVRLSDTCLKPQSEPNQNARTCDSVAPVQVRMFTRRKQLFHGLNMGLCGRLLADSMRYRRNQGSSIIQTS